MLKTKEDRANIPGAEAQTAPEGKQPHRPDLDIRRPGLSPQNTQLQDTTERATSSSLYKWRKPNSCLTGEAKLGSQPGQPLPRPPPHHEGFANPCPRNSASTQAAPELLWNVEGTTLRR